MPPPNCPTHGYVVGSAAALLRKGPRASAAAGPSRSRTGLRAPIHTGTWPGGDETPEDVDSVGSTRSRGLPHEGCSGIKHSAPPPGRPPEPPPLGEVSSGMRPGCSCLVWGTPFHVTCGMAHSDFQVQSLSSLATARPESAPSRVFERN
jgi:hypothetical protein